MQQDHVQRQVPVLHGVDEDLMMPLLVLLLQVVLLSREHQRVGTDGGDIGLGIVLRDIEGDGPRTRRQVVGAFGGFLRQVGGVARVEVLVGCKLPDAVEGGPVDVVEV